MFHEGEVAEVVEPYIGGATIYSVKVDGPANSVGQYPLRRWMHGGYWSSHRFWSWPLNSLRRARTQVPLPMREERDFDAHPHATNRIHRPKTRA